MTISHIQQIKQILQKKGVLYNEKNYSCFYISVYAYSIDATYSDE